MLDEEGDPGGGDKTDKDWRWALGKYYKFTSKQRIK
jgi:hypothetical protein